MIIPERARLDVRLLALCHHHPNNIYPALAIVGSEAVYPDLEYEEMERFTERIDAWVEERTLPVVIAEAQSVNAPTWAESKAGYG